MPKLPARVLAQPIYVVVLATAVLFGTFSGVGYAATRGFSKPLVTPARTISAPRPDSTRVPKSSPVTPPLVWHQLNLLNGWVSAASWGTGAPSYAVSAEGVVYFAGSLTGGNQNKPAFLMPVGTRPGFYDCFSIYSNSSSNVQEVGALHIYANGKAYVQGPSVQYFASISGTSYVIGH